MDQAQLPDVVFTYRPKQGMQADQLPLTFYALTTLFYTTWINRHKLLNLIHQQTSEWLTESQYPLFLYIHLYEWFSLMFFSLHGLKFGEWPFTIHCFYFCYKETTPILSGIKQQFYCVYRFYRLGIDPSTVGTAFVQVRKTLWQGAGILWRHLYSHV